MSQNLYSLMCYLALPLVWAKLRLRARKQPAYAERMQERLGHVPIIPSGERPLIWLHAVSVGETIAAIPLVEALLARQFQIVITSTTPTGSEQVQRAFGERVWRCYAPYDLPAAVERFIDRVRPKLLLVMETELWPNTLRLCRERGIETVLVNGRLSERSARGYGKWAGLSRAMLSNLSLALMQYPADAKRLAQLGMAQQAIEVCGSIKFDIEISADCREAALQLRSLWPNRPVWLAASTHPGEDDIILAAHRQLLVKHPNLLLVLVPRHPERADDIEPLCQGLSLVRRSHGAQVGSSTQVLMLDTLGELMAFYGACDIALVAGSLVPRGGHNLVEPAAWGVPVLSGPSVFNFATMAEAMTAAGGLQIVEPGEPLVQALDVLLSDPQARAASGERAWQFAENNRGALGRVLNALENYLPATE